MTQDRAPRAPYPGLRSFQRDETDLFFGREGCINAMVDRLAATHFLAVLGSSGTGKSSLVKTGLLDALELGLMANAGSRWRIVEFRPGGSPLKNLARRLLETADAEGNTEPAGSDVDLLRAFLARGPRSAIEWCRAGHLPKGENLLLLVDQFEELFRYQDYAGREEAEAVVALLLESARTKEFPIYVAITMRSEYLGACALIEGLADAINAGMFLTPRMTRELCREAIVGPAAVCDIDIEPALVNRLLNDLANFAPWDEGDSHDQLDRIMRRADQLPLLQYTLNRMWLRARAAGRNERIKLTIADYEAIGGLSGALNAHANQIFEELGRARWPVVESAFRTLTAGTTIADAVRRPTRFDELVAACGGDEENVRAVVDAFRAPGVNFLVPEFDSTHPRLAGDAYVDISHESLIRQWKRLGEWLEKEARSAQQWRRLIDRFGTGELMRGRELANMIAWRAETKPNASWAKRYGGDYQAVTAFLQNSHRVQSRKRFLIVGGAAVVFLTVGAEAIVATHYWRLARESLADNQAMLVRTGADAERAKLANDALVALFENMSNNAEQRTKSGAAITIDESLTAIRQFVASSPDDPELRRFLAINLNVYGDIRLQSNDVESARQAFEESLEIGRSLVRRDPNKFQWQEVFAAALARIAQVKAKTNALTEARSQFQEAIEILRRLVARDATEKLLNNIQSEKLLNSFQSQLGQFGDLLIRLSDTAAAIPVFNEKVEIHRKLVEIAPDDTLRQENLSAGLDKLGDLQRQKGDLAAARTAFEEELEIDRKLNQRDPNNKTSRRNLAFTLNRLGDILRRQNELASSRRAYEEIAAIDRKLAAEYPADSAVLNDYQSRLNRFGEVLALLNDRNTALAIYRERLEVSRKYLALDPNNADRLEIVSASLDKVGDLLTQTSDLMGARAAFEEALDIDRKLFARDSNKKDARTNLAWSLNRVADILRRQTDLAGSRRIYEELIPIHRKLAADFPEDAALLNTYQTHLNAFGELLVQIGDKSAALAIYRERLDVRRRQLALDADNTTRLESLSASLDKVGDLLSQLDDLAGALRAFEEALDIDRKLHARDPNKKDARTNLGFSLNRVADILRRQTDLTGSRRTYEELIAFDRKLTADFPDDASVLISFQSHLNSLGELLTQLRDRIGALAIYRERLDVRRRHLALDPDNIDRLENVSASLDKVGELLLQAGDVAGARKAFEEELEFDRKLSAREPNKKAAQQNLIFSLNRMADILSRSGDRPGAAKNYEESLAIDRRLSADYPADASVQDNYQSRAERLADLLLAIGNDAGAKRAFEDRFAGLQRLIAIRRQSYLSGGRTRQAESDLVDALAKATWPGLLSGHPQDVISYADEALKLDPTQRAAEVKRAHAWLLTGRLAEARVVYEATKKIPHRDDNKLTWIEYVKEDFAMLRRLGLANPNMELVAKELGI